MIEFDKVKIRELLTLDNIFELIEDWGGNPIRTPSGIVSSTICHNMPGGGSAKLYFYENSMLFRCYTGCDSSFDIFELAIKVAKLQQNKTISLNDAIRTIANRFSLAGERIDKEERQFPDWTVFSNYERIQEIHLAQPNIVLKEYDRAILDKFNYDIKLYNWRQEGIAQEALDQAMIGYYPGAEQISIPHFDKDGRFVGLRGRTLSEEEAAKSGKYRPMIVNSKMYNHPLGMNLYNLNFSKDNIKLMGKAILFEGEKSTLLYKSYFGIENDISVASCGNSISAYQIQLLIASGANEIVIAFDRQFQEIGDEEFHRLKKNLMRLHSKYKNSVTISFIFDKEKILRYKSSPIDEGSEKFLHLFKQRIIL